MILSFSFLLFFINFELIVCPQTVWILGIIDVMYAVLEQHHTLKKISAVYVLHFCTDIA